MIAWLRAKPAPGAPEAQAPAPGARRFAVRPQNSRHAALDEPGQTLSSVFALPAAPALVRLIFFNDLETGWTLDAAAAALTSSVGDGLMPRDESGSPDPSLWRRATFANEGADRDEIDRIDGSDRHALTLKPGSGTGGYPELYFSDWIPLDGPARADAPGALLMVRAFSNDRVRFSGCVGPPEAGVGLPSHGRVLQGNAAAPPYEGAAREDDRVFACYGVECIGAREVASVISIGDSTLHGSCSTGELSGLATRACVRASTPDRPIAFFNEASPGRNSIGFHRNGAWAIDRLLPSIALIQTWSQNEDWTREAADRAFARSLALCDHAARRACVPILATAAPVFAGQPEFEAHRARSVARVRAAGREGIRVLDLDAIWGDGGSPNAYRPEWGCGDGMHANDAGCEEAGQRLAAMLGEILARGA